MPRGPTSSAGGGPPAHAAAELGARGPAHAAQGQLALGQPGQGLANADRGGPAALECGLDGEALPRGTLTGEGQGDVGRDLPSGPDLAGPTGTAGREHGRRGEAGAAPVEPGHVGRAGRGAPLRLRRVEVEVAPNLERELGPPLRRQEAQLGVEGEVLDPGGVRPVERPRQGFVGPVAGRVGLDGAEPGAGLTADRQPRTSP